MAGYFPFIGLLTHDQWHLLIEDIPEMLQGTNMRKSSPARERLILECILWKLAMQVPWYDFPEAYPLLPAKPAKTAFDPLPSYQTIYRRYRVWLKAGLLTQILSTLSYDLKTRGGFDLAGALSSGCIKLSGRPWNQLGRKRSLRLTLDSNQQSSWQLLTALLLLSIAAG